MFARGEVENSVKKMWTDIIIVEQEYGDNSVQGTSSLQFNKFKY